MGFATPIRGPVATVSEILEKRQHAGEASKGLVTLISVVAHGSFIVFLALISRAKPATFVPTHIPISIVSPAALGRPSPPVTAPLQPAPLPAAPEVPKARPVIEKIQPDVVPPSAKALPLPKKSKEKPVKSVSPPTARPGAVSNGPPMDLPVAGGNSSGEATGTSNFGASVSAFDADFPFAYYVEQLQSVIGANWLKPNVPEGTACVVSFQIQRSGQVTDVKIDVASNLPFYDRAAARSVYAANPLPPLPPEFKGERLGVHLRFQ